MPWENIYCMYIFCFIAAGYFHKGTSIGSHEEWNTDQVFYGGFSGHGYVIKYGNKCFSMSGL